MLTPSREAILSNPSVHLSLDAEVLKPLVQQVVTAFQANARSGLICVRNSQVRVTISQFRQKTTQFRQPGIAQKVLRSVFLFDATPQRFHKRLIGQATSRLEGTSLQDICSLHSRPGQTFRRQVREVREKKGLRT